MDLACSTPADTPVVAINGARQAGKTTLVESLPYPGTVEFVTLDDPAARQAASLLNCSNK